MLSWPGAARHAAGRSSPRRPAAPTRRWLRRPASYGRHRRGRRQQDRLGGPGPDRAPDRSADDRHHPPPQHGCWRRAGQRPPRDRCRSPWSGCTCPGHRHASPRRSRGRIEQGETRFEAVRWVTPHQIAANQIIPLPEPARRGLVNAATDVAEATNQAVAAAAQLGPTERAPRVGAERSRRGGRAATEREIPVHHPNRGGRSR
jgi:hypothetical protein